MSRLEVVRPRTQTRLERLWDTVRSYTLGPLSLKDPEIRKYFQGRETSTGIAVNEYSALNYSAVWSAVKLISSDVAGLPLVLYQRNGERKKRFESHPLYRILHDAPNPEMSSFTFRQTLQAHSLTWGNGYAEIERDKAGRPRYLWPITPDRVSAIRDTKGRLIYRVGNDKGVDTVFDAADMLHVPGLGWDGVSGYGVIAKARESVSLGIASEKFGGKFYGNGSTFGGTITHPTRFATPTARENFEKALRSRNQGVDRAHNLLLLEEGMTYTQIGIPPDQAQFLESRQFQITEIARWFNVPPHKIGDLSRATFSNIEQQNIEYLQTTLIHWLETWEQELMRKLISPLERNQQFIEHVVEGLLRGDSVGRAALQTAEFNIGALTSNEARGLSNRDPVTGGDRPFVPLNMIPLDRVDEWIDAQIANKKAPKVAPPPSNGGTRADTERVIAALTADVARLSEANGRIEEQTRHAEQRAEDLSEARAQLDTALTESRAEYAHALELLDSARTALASEQVDRARDKADADERLAKALEAQSEAERRYEGERGTVDVVTGQLQAAVHERNVERQRADQAESALTVALAERDAAVTGAGVSEQARQAAVGAQTLAESERAAAIQRASDAARDQGIAEQAQAAANQMIAGLQDELATSRAEQQQTREAHAARVNGILVAHRGLVVDVMRRMVEREIDRAKRHQATPQKFRAWIDTFYQTHVDAIADALLPAVRAHLAILSSNADALEMARQLAEDHVGESQRQLRDLLHMDEFGPMLERTMTKWEASRPEMVADRLLTKGLADVR